MEVNVTQTNPEALATMHLALAMLHQYANDLSWDKKTRPISDKIRSIITPALEAARTKP